MKSSGIGGQAVLEGVMMKNQDEYAVAVRVPDKGIIVDKKTYSSISKKYKVLRLPIVRGVVNFIDSMIIGTRTLAYSSGLFEEEDDKKKTTGKTNESEKSGDGLMMAVTICISIILAIGIFMILPFFIGNLVSGYIKSSVLLGLVEGLIRLVIFIGYIGAISQMKDIKRVFMYHGAEHKTINCIEHGYELTVDNVRLQSRQHKRCGTSFMLLVMFVSIIFFIFIKVDTIWMRVVYRILLVPVIAGVSYEFIRLAGRSDSTIVSILSKPGLLLQGLTTREPDDDMIEVAIKSVEAVFDWKKYLSDNSNQWNTNENETVSESPEVAETAAAREFVNKVSDHGEDISINDQEDEEEDEILRALDHYFDTPEANVLEEEQSVKED